MTRRQINIFLLLLLMAGATACAGQRCKCPKVRYQEGVLPALDRP